jgi:hypothetical protein
MGQTFRFVLMGLVILGCGRVHAQQDQLAFPKVLIIGDAVYSQFARDAVNELKGQAGVQIASWPSGVLHSSTNMIEHLDLLLGIKNAAGNELPEDKRPSWDLIHLNVGLGDLIHCVPHLQSHRVLPRDLGGVPRTDPMQYEKNLDTIVRLLKQKAPQAKIVWASTTPIRQSRDGLFKPGDEVEYNQIAMREMQKHGIPINDMHGYVRTFLDMDKPAAHGADPFDFDKQPLHPPIVDVIVRELHLKPIPRMSE